MMGILKTALKGIAKTAILPYGIATTAISKLKGGEAQKQQTKEIIAGAAIGAGAITLAVAPGLVVGAAKSLIPKSPIGKIALGTTGLLAGGAFIAQPKLVSSAVVKTPSSIVNVGGNVANLISDPSIKNATNIFTENPIVASGLAVAGLVATGALTGGVVSTLLNTSAIKENTAATLSNFSSSNNIPVEYATISGTSGSNVPLTPETQVLGKAVTSSSTRSVVKRKKQVPQMIKQSVKVNVLTANQSRIKMRSYLN